MVPTSIFLAEYFNTTVLRKSSISSTTAVNILNNYGNSSYVSTPIGFQSVPHSWPSFSSSLPLEMLAKYEQGRLFMINYVQLNEFPTPPLRVFF